MTLAPNSLQARDLAYHIHPQTDLRRLEKTGPVVITHGKGVYIYDEAGREILDGFSGLGCMTLGYDEPRLAEAAHRQMRALPFAPTFYGRTHPTVVELAEKLSRLAPVPHPKILFQCSGSEANDTAVKLIWYYNNALGRPEKKKIIGRTRGYHGNTVATVSLSGQPHMHARFDPIPLPMFRHLSNPNYYRFHLEGESEEEFSARMAAEFEQMILDEGPDTVAAFFAEPIQSGGGAIFPPAGYWPAMQAVIRKYDMLFVADEVVTGFGRTGNWWGCQTYDLRPDLVSCAKGLTAGHLPMSALMVPEFLYDAMVEQSGEVGVFGHGYTYAGHPVSAAVALETLRIYEEDDIVGHVQAVAPRFQEGMRVLRDHPLVGDVQGIGLFAGLELVKDKRTREPFDPALKVGALVQDLAHDQGLYLRAIGDRINCNPPLIITEVEIDELLRRFKIGLDEAWAAVRKRAA